VAVNALDGEIHSGRHVMPVRVYYEDTDFTGIVYHANYLRFMERGRSNYLRLLGANQRSMFAQAEQEAPGFAFVVRSMQIEFLKSARMDEVVDVVTEYREIKGASILLWQEVRRGEELLATALVRVAFVSGGAPARSRSRCGSQCRPNSRAAAADAQSGLCASTDRLGSCKDRLHELVQE
jgi:acyl-CoA thioester hydrolase